MYCHSYISIGWLGAKFMYISLSLLRYSSAELSDVCQTAVFPIGKWMPDQEGYDNTASPVDYAAIGSSHKI